MSHTRPALAAAMLLLGACGGGDDVAADPDAADLSDVEVSESIMLSATEMSFSLDRVAVESGPVQVTFTNAGNMLHDLRIKDTPLFLEAGRGDTDSGSVDLAPGQYTFFCTLPGHRGAGMEGVIEAR